MSFNYETKNNVLTKIISNNDKEENLGWIRYCVRVPDGVIKIASNIFDESCVDNVLGILIPDSVKEIAIDAFNIKQLALIVENNDTPLNELIANIIFFRSEKYVFHIWPVLFLLFRLYDNSHNPKWFIKLLMRFQDVEGPKEKNSFILVDFHGIEHEVEDNSFKLECAGGAITVMVEHQDDVIQGFSISNSIIELPNTYIWTQGEKLNKEKINRLLKSDVNF